MQYFNGSESNSSDTYDMRDPEQNAAARRVLTGLFAPMAACFLPAVYLMLDRGAVAIPVALIFCGVFFAMIGAVSAVIRNKEMGIGACRPEDIAGMRAVRSLMIVMFACATFIPFLPYILAKIFARRYPESGFYQPGMNLQVFSLIWSLIGLICAAVIGLLWRFGVLR